MNIFDKINHLEFYKQQIIIHDFQQKLEYNFSESWRFEDWKTNHPTLAKLFIPLIIYEIYSRINSIIQLNSAIALAKKHTTDWNKVADIKQNMGGVLAEVVTHKYRLSQNTFKSESYTAVRCDYNDFVHRDWIVFKKSDSELTKSASSSLREFLEKKNRSYTMEAFEESIGKEAIKDLTNEYKIHLMPKIEKAESVFKKVISILDKKEVSENVQCFKFLHCPLEQYDINNQLTPKAVIYVQTKEAAQQVLKIFRENLQNLEECGTGKTPRFNKKVTNLLFYANGDSHCKVLAKKRGVFDQWFDAGGVHYKTSGLISNRSLINS